MTKLLGIALVLVGLLAYAGMRRADTGDVPGLVGGANRWIVGLALAGTVLFVVEPADVPEVLRLVL